MWVRVNRGKMCDVERKCPLRIAAVVLAAGMSRRMGSPKALLTLGDKPVLIHVIDALVSAGGIDPIVVVTGHEPGPIGRILQPFPVHVVHNEAYASGEMLSSVKTGVWALVPARADAFFIALSDHPMVRPKTISALASAWEQSRPRVLLPTFKQKHGHPILLSAAGAEEILALPADATLKTYTSRYAKHTLELSVDDPAILHDLDTPADYQAAAGLLQRRTGSCPDSSLAG